MPAAQEVLSTVIGVALTIKSKIEQMESNQEEYKRFLDRITTLSGQLRVLQKSENIDHIEKELRDLNEILGKAVELEMHFADPKNKTAKQFVFSDKHKEELATLEKQLDQFISQLQLGIATKTLVQQEQYQANMEKSIGSIIETMKKLATTKTRESYHQKPSLFETEITLKEQLNKHNDPQQNGLQIRKGRWLGQNVIIKYVSGTATNKDLELLVREIKILSNLKNGPSIVNFYAGSITSKGERVWAVFDYDKNSKTLSKLLNTVYTKQSDKNNNNINNQPQKAHLFSFRRQLKIAYHIAAAIHFIHQQHFVHRHLSIDTILVDEYDKIKISDFSRAKINDPDIDTSDIHSVNSNSNNEANSQSHSVLHKKDIYDFGIILLQIFSGRLNLESNQVPDILNDIKAVFPEIAELIEACCSDHQDARPNADVLMTRFEQIKKSISARTHYEEAQQYHAVSDYKRAKDLFQKASKKGYAKANTYTAYYVWKGLFYPPEPVKALDMLLKNAKKPLRHEVAMEHLIQAYETGHNGITKDITKAIYWCDKLINKYKENMVSPDLIKNKEKRLEQLKAQQAASESSNSNSESNVRPGNNN